MKNNKFWTRCLTVIATTIVLVATADRTFAAAEIEVRVDTLTGTDLADGAAGGVSFGTTVALGSPVSKTFFVKNVGTTDNLTVDNLTGAADGFTVTTQPGASVAPGANTSFTVRFQSNTRGDHMANLSFINGDGDGNETPFNITVKATVAAPDFTVEEPAGTAIDPPGTLPAAYPDTDVAATTNPTKTFRIRNTLGNATLNITSVTSSNTTDFMISSITPPTTVSAGGNRNFVVTFNPASYGPKTTTISINHDDPDGTANPFRFTLSGTAQAPDISVIPVGDSPIDDGNPADANGWGTYAFGSRAIGGTVRKTFTIRNNGNAELTDLKFDITQTSGDFLTGSLPTSVPGRVGATPGEATFDLDFIPSSAGPRTAIVRIENNDPGANKDPFLFELTGEGQVVQPDRDAFGYIMDPSITPNFRENLGGTKPAGLVGDDRSESLNIGFTFSFYENEYTSLYASSNGLISFTGPSPQYTPSDLPSANAPNNIIAPFWTDLRGDSGGNITYKTVGEAPNRVFILEYDDVRLYEEDVRVTFQVHLFEGTNVIEFHYKTIPAFAATINQSVAIGIENSDGSIARKNRFNRLRDGVPASTSAIRFSRPVLSRIVSLYDRPAGGGTNIPVGSTALGFSPEPNTVVLEGDDYGSVVSYEAPEFIYLDKNFSPFSVPSGVEADATNRAVYRLVNDGYALDGKIVQGTQTFFTETVTRDLTVIWRWKLEYAVFIEAVSSAAGTPVNLQDGVGNPGPVLGRHWVAENTDFTASIDRVSGNDFLNSDTGGFRYETQSYDVSVKDATPTPSPQMGDTGNRVTTETITISDWTTVRWFMAGQVRYRFDAATGDTTVANNNFLGQSFVRIYDGITHTFVAANDIVELGFEVTAAADLQVVNVSTGVPLALTADYTVTTGNPSSVTITSGAVANERIRINNISAPNPTKSKFGLAAFNEIWIDLGDRVEVGAFYRTMDRCFTLADFPTSQGGDLVSLSTDVSELQDREIVDAAAMSRVARVHLIPGAGSPTEVHFLYTPTVFRAEIPIGEYLDSANPQLVPDLCVGATLRSGAEGPSGDFRPVGEFTTGTKLGLPARWDQVSKRLFPVHPGSYQLEWPDANDPNKIYKIEIVTGYPGDTVPLASEREHLLPSGDSKRETSITLSTQQVFDSQGNPIPYPPVLPFPNDPPVPVPATAKPLYYVTSATLNRVSEDFPGSAPAPRDAHYRHLYDPDPERIAPSRLDLLDNDQWKFIEMPYTDRDANFLVDNATTGVAFTPQGVGRCVLLYSSRPNPDEVATGSLPEETLTVRVVRSERKVPVVQNSPKLVLGRRGLELDGTRDLHLDGTGGPVALGSGFVIDFWLNGSGLSPEDGEVTVFGTAEDKLKVTLTNNLSSTTVVLGSETEKIPVPFGFAGAADLVVTNVTTGDPVPATDFVVTDGVPAGAPNGSVTLKDTATTAIGNTVRVELATPRAPASTITATYQGVTVTHPFSATGIDWRHYVIHVFEDRFFGTDVTLLDFYVDGIRREQGVLRSSLPVQTLSIASSASASANALRFGVGADAASKLQLDQFRVFGGLRSTSGATRTGSDPWLRPRELMDLRTKRSTMLRAAAPQLWFNFESAPTSGSFANNGTSTALNIGPVPADSTGIFAGAWAHTDIQEVATRLNSTLDNAGFGGTGYVLNRISNYNADIYDRDADVGTWGPIFPVNDRRLFTDPARRLEVAYYENPFRIDEFMHPNVAWPYEAAGYDEVVYPSFGPHKERAIYIASRLGSEGVDKQGKLQTVFGLERYANLKIYNQPVRDEPGYNANEEHALAAGANRAALKIKEIGEDIPNNPPLAAFALQKDINVTSGAGYTSDPWVLVQVDNLVTGEPEMAAYEVFKTRLGKVHFPRPSDTLVNATAGLSYESAANPEDRFLVMDPTETYDFSYAFSYPVAAGDLLIPPYPLNLVIGNTPTPDARGGNHNTQRTVWRDVNGIAWVVSGDGRFFYQYFYPFRGDFYLPSTQPGTPVAWVPDFKNGTRTFTGDGASLEPGEVVYHSFWRSGYPKLKRGETLTYQGGEYFNENPGSNGLPALVAMKAAEIVYDDATPTMIIGDNNVNDFTARIIRPLDRNEARFTVAQMAAAGFSPAAESISVVAERWYFTDLPGSLGKRFYFDSLAQKLVFRGYLNDKDSGAPNLTAGPDPLNILEPNVITAEDLARMLPLGTTMAWTDAITGIYEKSQNPTLIRDETPPTNPAVKGVYLAGMRESPVVTARIGLNRNLYGASADLTAETARIAKLAKDLQTLEKQWDVQFASLFNIDSGQAALRTSIAASAVNAIAISQKISKLGYEITALPTQAESRYSHLDSFGVGSALVANPKLFTAPVNGSRYITIVENNRSELDGAPISLHVIEIIPDRYRGALKVIESADAFSEKVTIQHSGDFGANTGDLYYEWWIRDAGPLDAVDQGDGKQEVRFDGTLAETDFATGQTLWQQYLPEPVAPKTPAQLQALGVTSEEAKHLGLHTIVFEGRPDVTLADKLVLMRYRHRTESDWKLVPFEFSDPAAEWKPGNVAPVSPAPFQWAGAANSPQLQASGRKRYVPQLVMGWVKRVLDRINPYEARYTDFFSNESPAIYSSQIQIAGAPFAGKVALNSDKNVIENTGLIELYETVLARAKELSIDNSSNPVSTPGINQAILLAATRLAVLYELLAREAYGDAQDSTITVSEDSGLTHVASYTHAFQNFEASLQHEELALLRGTDFRKSYPVYNRMFWNYAKGLGEAAYNVNYNIYDWTGDGFINEDDARALFPQGHGDAWGHFLSALGMHYELLRQPVFSWASRSELYSLMQNVLEVDFLDEKTFAKLAAGKARAGRDIVRGTYRLSYTQDADGQWQGYSDGADPARAWGVSEWAHRTGQAAYFDWAVANALLPDEAASPAPGITPENLDLIQRSAATEEIGSIAGGLLEIQTAMDEANNGVNPLGFDSDALAFDLNLEFYENASGGDRRSHFEQIHARAVTAANNALATLDFASQAEQKLRNIANDTDALVVAAIEQDLDYRGRLIEIFGRPYDGTIGFGKAYPEGYLGPDTLLHAYLDRTTIEQIIPVDSSAASASKTKQIQFDDIKAKVLGVANDSTLVSIYTAAGSKSELADAIKTFVSGQDYQSPLSLSLTLPVQEASDYAFQAPADWGQRTSYGELQRTLEEMLAEQLALDAAINEYLGFLGDLDTIALTLLNSIEGIRDKERLQNTIDDIRKSIDSLILVQKTAELIVESFSSTLLDTSESVAEALPTSLGFSNDATAPGRAAIRAVGVIGKIIDIVGGTVGKIATLVAELLRDELIANTERDIARVDYVTEIEGILAEFENLSGSDAPLRAGIGAHLQQLEILRQQYFTSLNAGFSLLREREVFNKILAASVQQNRYQDMVFRLSRNEAMTKYQSAFTNAARYTWLAARAYDYETSLDPGHPAAPGTLLDQIVKERQLGLWADGEPQAGQGGLAEILAKLGGNFGVIKGQLGIENPQSEVEKISLRNELFRIKPHDAATPANSAASDDRWKDALKARIVPDITALPEFARYCRPFSTAAEGPQPGLVIRFSSHIENGLNFFGRPLGPGDHSYSAANFATKVRGFGVWMENYNAANLSTTPRAYMVPVGNDYLRTSSSAEPATRMWSIQEQRIPTPYVINQANLTAPGFIPSLDGVDGSFGELRRHGDFRMYHDNGDPNADDSELILDTRLIGRSVWNSEWLLIIPGANLHHDPITGLTQLADTIGDIKLHFLTYSHQGQ